MKKLIIMWMLSTCTLQAQFVELQDQTSKNKFLGVDMSVCSVQVDNSRASNKAGHYQKSYNCGNGTISELLNVNFLDPQLLGQQFYFFNNFMYWMSSQSWNAGDASMGEFSSKENKVAHKQAAATAQPDEIFSGTGVFMVNVGTSAYLQDIVAPNKTCPKGEKLLVGQLKYNNGNSLATWSQDAICLAPTDTFKIVISHDKDNSVPAGTDASTHNVDAQGVDWMKDPGPTGNYDQATSSPRKIRFVLDVKGVDTMQETISSDVADIPLD